MLTKPANQKSNRTLIFGGLFVSAACLAQPVAADSLHYASGPDPIDREFRASHPIKVYVDVSNDRRIRSDGRRRTDADDLYVRDRLHYQLPPYVILVSSRRKADMTIQAQLLDYDLSFHITDVDRRNKKYKKRYRYTGGRCGQHKRAFYDRITEKGVALADYKLSVRLKGIANYADTARIRSADSYRYGENLRALTNCGVAPAVHYPNKDVAKLFTRTGGLYRDTVAQEVRQKNLRNLSNLLAGTIRARTEQFYAELARGYARIDHLPRKQHHRRADDRVYDYDDVDADTYRRRGWRK